MTFDVQAIKERTDLLALIGHDTELHRVSGAEYAGPCPRCGGEDRFHVHESGWWFCRQCHDKRGDAIAYVQWARDVAFAEACELLGGEKSVLESPRGRETSRKVAKRSTSEAVGPPGELWQVRARAFVAYAQGQLWAHDDALAYLRGRGLADETIRAAGLGWCPRDWSDDPERWGLDRGHLQLWQGWVIPCEVAGALQYVTIRRPRGEPKYIALRGSKKAGVIYGLDAVPGHTDVVLAEGEFNALILRQVLVGTCAVVSVGDAGNMPGSDALAKMAAVRRWWLAFDPDAPGQKGASRIAEAYARARPLAWPWGDRGAKYDVNDAHLAGEDLAAWVIPQIGPEDQKARRAWCVHHLNRLDDAAFAAQGNDADPALRAWEALLGEYEKAHERAEISSVYAH